MKHKIIGAARGRGANRAKAVAGLFLLTSTLLVTYVGPAGATGATTHTGGGSIAPHCGDTLSGPGTAITYTLSASVDCTSHYLTPTNGLIIGADNVTLNLNGHSVIGASVANGGDEAGILIDGVDGATITDNSQPKGNAVTGFDAGVAIVNGAANNTVENLTIVGNVGLDGDYGEGVHVNGSSANIIQNNKLSENGPYAGISLSNNSDGNTVQGNTIAANTVTHQDIAIRLESWDAVSPCPDNNVVDNNVIAGNTLDGISILNGKACNATGNTLSNNKISGHARDGIRLNARLFLDLGVAGECRGAAGTQVYGNVTVGNAGAGIRATACVGNSYIHDNTSLDNNPDVAPAVVNSPLLPPHGDLHDNNVDCTPSRPGTGGVNKWGGDDPATTAVEADNVHVTEYAAPGSAATIPLVDYVCVK